MKVELHLSKRRPISQLPGDVFQKIVPLLKRLPNSTLFAPHGALELPAIFIVAGAGFPPC